MGLGGISIWQLLIILVIVALIFGTKRLKNIGSDLGSAVKGFKDSVSTADKAESEQQGEQKTGTEDSKDTARVADAGAEKEKAGSAAAEEKTKAS